MLKAITGKDVTRNPDGSFEYSDEIDDSEFKEGVIPSYDNELDFWESMEKKYPDYAEIILGSIIRVDRKREASLELFRFTETTIEDRRRIPPHILSPDEWEEAIEFWNQFILY